MWEFAVPIASIIYLPTGVFTDVSIVSLRFELNGVRSWFEMLEMSGTDSDSVTLDTKALLDFLVLPAVCRLGVDVEREPLFLLSVLAVSLI